MERFDLFWILIDTSTSPSSKTRAEESLLNATRFCSATPPESTSSSILLPDDETSAFVVLNAAQVRKERRTTATVTNCWLRKTRPRRYRAIAKEANIADFLLHATSKPP